MLFRCGLTARSDVKARQRRVETKTECTCRFCVKWALMEYLLLGRLG